MTCGGADLGGAGSGEAVAPGMGRMMPTLHHLVAEISRILRGAEQATGDPCH